MDNDRPPSSQDRFQYGASSFTPAAPAKQAAATRYDADVKRLEKQVEDLEKELGIQPGGEGLDAKIQAAIKTAQDEGVDPSLDPRVTALVTRKGKATDDYKAASTALISARKVQADEQATEGKRQAALANRAKKSGRVPQTETDYLSDLEDAHALGEMTDAEVTAKHNAWVRANVSAPKEAETARIAAENTRQSQATSQGNLAVSQGNLALSQQAGARAATAQTSQLSQQDTTNKINVAKEARAAGEDARKSARDSSESKRRTSLARAIAGGKSAKEGLAAAYADDDPDFDAIADRAAQRFLASIGMGPPPGAAPGAAPAGAPTGAPPTAGPPPVGRQDIAAMTDRQNPAGGVAAGGVGGSPDQEEIRRRLAAGYGV